MIVPRAAMLVRSMTTSRCVRLKQSLPLLKLVVGLQIVTNGLRVLSKIEYPVDDDHVVLDEMVDREGESSG